MKMGRKSLRGERQNKVDSPGRDGGKERGSHWHDILKPGEHINSKETLIKSQ